ncbi:MAG: pyruvate kinase alpha/beta domain-containing protein, partial [Candidatus Pacebacteria bacterium]|nr:pyruvate kinase alpha/beta domain-containing protein [Candidatus Paceibacterota bacterium]
PVEAVTMMSRIIAEVEKDPLHRKTMKAGEPTLEPTSADAITAAACQVAETVSAAVIVTYTTSGSTTLRASRERPSVPVLGLTSRVQTARQLTLAWGVHPIQTADVTNFSEMIERASTIALREGLAAAGDTMVVTAGVPFGTPGRTNTLRVVTLGKS